MPKRIVKQPIALIREGKTIKPEVGTEFDFTQAELTDINSVNPKAVAHIVLPDESKAAVKTEAPKAA